MKNDKLYCKFVNDHFEVIPPDLLEPETREEIENTTVFQHYRLAAAIEELRQVIVEEIDNTIRAICIWWKGDTNE